MIALGGGSRPSTAILTRFGGILRLMRLLAECLQRLAKILPIGGLTGCTPKRIVSIARSQLNKAPRLQD